MNSVHTAHGIKVSDKDTKEDKSINIMDHVTKGKCVENKDSAPGCEEVAKKAGIVRENSVHLQITVLKRVIEVASKKQLCNVLDIHEIEYDAADKFKKLRDRLKKYIQGIE